MFKYQSAAALALIVCSEAALLPRSERLAQVSTQNNGYGQGGRWGGKPLSPSPSSRGWGEGGRADKMAQISTENNGYGKGGRWAAGGKPSSPSARGWGQGGRSDK